MMEVRFHTDNLLVTMDPGIPFQLLAMLVRSPHRITQLFNSLQVRYITKTTQIPLFIQTNSVSAVTMQDNTLLGEIWVTNKQQSTTS